MAQRMAQLDRQNGAAARASSMPEWARRCSGEPRLEELLEDPIMRLIWRRDRLDPYVARARVRALQTALRGRQQDNDEEPADAKSARRH